METGMTGFVYVYGMVSLCKPLLFFAIYGTPVRNLPYNKGNKTLKPKKHV